MQRPAMAIDPDDTGDLLMDVARRLRMTRLALGLTQAEIAERTGLGRTQYNQFETGKRILTLTAALSLSEKFAVSLDWLYRGDASSLPHKLFIKIQDVNNSM